MSLTILTVVEDAPAPIRPERQSRYGASGDAATYVKDLAHHWTDFAPEVSGQVVRDPISPAGGIRTYLEQQPAGLIALTSHARSGLQRVLFGATAASIVHASVSPCLVVPLQR
jgi:nucleotide-binding universal stress UspA family protein